jgi:MFS family permease
VGQSVPVLALARFLQGASGGVVWTIGLAIIIETVGQDNLGTTMGTIFSFVSVAGLFSPLLGGVLYASAGYKGVFGLGIGLVAIDFVLRVLMVEKKVAARYDDANSLQAGTDGARDDTEQTPLLPNASAHERYRLAKPKNRITRSLPILLLFRDPGLLTAIWISSMQALLLGAFDATVPLVASEQFDFNSLKAGLLFLPLGGADFLFVLLRLATEAAIAEKLDSARHIALYAGLLAANGLGLAIINSPAIVEAGNIVEKYYKANEDVFEQAPYASLYGISSMVFSGGLTLGPLLAGHLREKLGYGNMNAVLAVICGLTAIPAGFLMGKKEEDLGSVEED